MIFVGVLTLKLAKTYLCHGWFGQSYSQLSGGQKRRLSHKHSKLKLTTWPFRTHCHCSCISPQPQSTSVGRGMHCGVLRLADPRTDCPPTRPLLHSTRRPRRWYKMLWIKQLGVGRPLPSPTDCRLFRMRTACELYSAAIHRN